MYLIHNQNLNGITKKALELIKKDNKMQKINLTNDMAKRIESNEYYSKEDFIKDCQTYIKALKSGRLQYRVTSVSKSGMSRDILISSFEGSMAKGYYRNYVSMLEMLGFNFASKYASEIKVKGCGMNMLFATNYNIIHTFKNIGLISKKQCETLAQIIN